MFTALWYQMSGTRNRVGYWTSGTRFRNLYPFSALSQRLGKHTVQFIIKNLSAYRPVQQKLLKASITKVFIDHFQADAQGAIFSFSILIFIKVNHHRLYNKDQSCLGPLWSDFIYTNANERLSRGVKINVWLLYLWNVELKGEWSNRESLILQSMKLLLLYLTLRNKSLVYFNDIIMTWTVVLVHNH